MMNTNKKLNERLEKIVRYYRNIKKAKVNDYTDNKMADRKKSPISTRTERLLNDDKSHQNQVVNNNNCRPSPFGNINGVVPQRSNNGQYSDSRPCYKISSDEQNDNMGRRSPGSDNLGNKSVESGHRGRKTRLEEDELKDLREGKGELKDGEFKYFFNKIEISPNNKPPTLHKLY